MNSYPNSQYWICKNGKQIRYKDMTNEHLKRVVELVSDWIVRFRYKCMVNNEVLDIPEWLEETITAINEEYDRRLENKIE